LVRSKPYFRLIHDGSQTAQGRRYFFTRTYELLRHGQGTGVAVKFVYDYRSNMADVTIDDVARDVINQSHIQEVNDGVIDKVFEDAEAKRVATR
jgi:hypothetical protein